MKLVLLTTFLIPMGINYLLFPELSLFHNLVISWARMGISAHITFLVNSVAHIWGDKPYDKFITPTDNKSVALVTLGEGWHNYHHTFPWDYKAAELGGSFYNLATVAIHFFAWIGWAYDLKSVSHSLLVDRINRTGDICHPLNMHHHRSGDYKSDQSKKNSNDTDDIKTARACWGWGDTTLDQNDVEITETLFPLKKG